MLFLLASCGGGGGGGGGDVDAAIADADPTLGEATVRTDYACCVEPVHAPGEAVGGIDVVVQDPGGATRTYVTGDDGTATIELAPGSSVTAIYRLSAAEATMMTYLDAQPGDSLRFGETPYGGILFGATGTMNVDVPPYPNASGYDVASSCSTLYADPAFGDQPNVQHTAICNPASEDIYLFAYVDMKLAAYGVLPDQTFVDGGTITLPSWTPAEDFAIDMTNVPDEATDAFLALVAIGNGVDMRADFIEGAPSGGAFGGTIPWSSAADAMAASSGVLGPDGFQTRVVPFTPGTTGFTIVDPATLPWVKDRELDFDTETIRFSLDEAATTDATVARLYYTRSDTDEVEWRVWAPPAHAGANELELPDLPAAYDDLDLRTATNGNAGVELRDFDTVDGYDAVRALPMFDHDGPLMERTGGKVSGQ
jgi:hypothetical protein